MVAAISAFGRLADGRPVQAVDLVGDGLTARVLDYGARLAVYRRGEGPNVCIPGDLTGYEGRQRFVGPVIGPVINRIGGARALVDGRVCRFEANQDGAHSLHSGAAGTHLAVWDIVEAGSAAVTLRVALGDGAGGFPGNRTITARYALEDGGLTLALEASTDAPTLMNPGLHGVFNPDGADDRQGLLLTIPAESYLPVDADTLPTGEIAPVTGSVFDHRRARVPVSSLDHNFCFDGAFGLRARLQGTTGALEIHSDAPGLQAYAGGREGVALEPQLWPDAPNHAGFPPITLAPGERFSQRSRYLIDI